MLQSKGNKNVMNTIILVPCKLFQNNTSLPAESTTDLLMCRTCANTLPKHNLLPLFERPQLHEYYSRSLLSATGLQIKMNDALPQHICNTCSDTIKNVLRFRKSCDIAHKVLIKATSKRILPQTTDEIEKSADKFVPKHADIIWSNTKITIKADNYEREIKTNECNVTSQNVTRNVDSSLIKVNSGISEKNDVSSKINNNLKSLTKYVDVELTPMFDDTESLDGEEDFHKNPKSNDVSGKIKIRAGIEATTDACENSKKRCKSQRSSNRPALLAQYLDESAPLYTCKDCKKCYAIKGSFVAHTQVHRGLTFMCEECSKVFRNSTSLRVHQRGVHGKIDSKLKCPYCEYYGIDKTYLKEHIRKHTGERPYVCDTCGAGFRSRTSIHQHLSLHITEKTVQCEQCPSMFASRFHLKVHRNKSHRPRRWSYQCPRCPKMYNKIYSYRKHMRNVHGVPNKEQENPVRMPSGLYL